MVRQGKFEDMNPTGISGLLRRMGDVLEQLLTRLQPGENSIIVNYPPTGNKDLPEGTHTFDFIERRVYLSDGTTEHMYTSEPIETCKSIFLSTDAVIDVKLYLHNNLVYETEISPKWVRNSNIEFDEMKVTTAKPTIFHLQASNKINGVQNIEESIYYTGNPYISNTNVAVVGTPNIEDIRDGASTINGAARDDTAQCLNQNAHSGYIYNMGPGDLSIEFNDGSGYSGAETLQPNMTRDLGDMDIARVRIDTTINVTSYILGAQ